MNALWVVATLAALRGWARSSLRWWVIAWVVIAVALLFPFSASPSEQITYRGNLTMKVFEPDKPNGKAVLVVHGGGWWTRSPGERIEGICTEIVTANGYTCFAPEYTLSSSRPFPAANHDLLAAVDYIHAQGFKKVGAVGISAGGNLVAWLATKGVFETSVIWSAPTDLVKLMPDDWTSTCGCPGVIRQFAPRSRDRRAASPVYRVNKRMGSMLIVHSAEEVIPLAQARLLDRVVPTQHRLSILRGSAHGSGYFDKEIQETSAWLVSHL
jgi:acetyl esterase